MEFTFICNDVKGAYSLYSKKFKGIFCAVIIIAAILATVGVALNIIESIGAKDFIGTVMYSVFVLAILFLAVLIPYNLLKKQENTNKVYFGKCITFIFKEHGFEYENRSDISISNTKATYECIYKVKETKDLLSIFLTSAGAVFVYKNDLQNSTLEEFRNFASQQLGVKFKCARNIIV